MPHIMKSGSCDTDIDTNPVRGFLLPRSMHNLYLNQTANVLIELIHQKIHVKTVVELPAFPDHWVTENIAQFHCVNVVAGGCGKARDMGELDG